MRKHSILLVDDDEFIVRTMGRAIEQEGYQVTVAESGETALELICHQHFDLVLTDLVMHEVSGLDVLKAVRNTHPEAIVLILTGYGDLDSAIEALRLSADDYLLKPCETEEILIRIARGIEKLELKRRIKAYEEILPICCVCKKIRDDAERAPGTGKWMSVESYIWTKARLAPSSTYCPECAQKVMREYGIE